MRKLYLNNISLALILVLLGSLGCDKNNTQQTPLPLGELSAAFEKAFGKAKPEVKELANQVVKSIQSQDYPKAFQDIQSLSGAPGLTKEQASTVGRGRLTINELLQAAEAKGDEKAATTLENYQRTK